jgi:hypothetical protein
MQSLMQNDHDTRPPGGRPHPRLVAAAAATGAAAGLVLAASRSSAAAGGCRAAAGHLGACAPGALIAAKPYVTAGLIGMMLAALIAIAAVLLWHEMVTAFEAVGRGEPSRRRSSMVSGGRRAPAATALTPRPRH